MRKTQLVSPHSVAIVENLKKKKAQQLTDLLTSDIPTVSENNASTGLIEVDELLNRAEAIVMPDVSDSMLVEAVLKQHPFLKPSDFLPRAEFQANKHVMRDAATQAGDHIGHIGLRAIPSSCLSLSSSTSGSHETGRHDMSAESLYIERIRFR